MDNLNMRCVALNSNARSEQCVLAVFRSRRLPRVVRPPGSDLLNAALDDVARFGRLPVYRRRQVEREVDALLEVLDRDDGDTDLEPSEGDLDHLPDDDSVLVLEVCNG